MESERYERGLKLMTELNEQAPQVIERIADLSPDFARYVVEFGYGEIYARPALTLRERQIATLASLVTQGGAEPQLAYHVQTALNAGLTPAEIVETIVNCAPLAGFPRALNALRTAGRALGERGAGPSE